MKFVVSLKMVGPTRLSGKLAQNKETPTFRSGSFTTCYDSPGF